MSVSLLIEKVDGNETKQNVPVSSEEAFRDHWLPISRKLSLQWIPLFESGASFNQEDLPDILEELNLLKESLSNFLDSASNEYLYIIERVEILIQSLTSLKGKEVEFFIG